MRVLLYTGKGGVGKTTVAAATAVRCADLGYRTLIISTDPAHSLGDSLDVKLGDHPTLVRENLWGQEVNALHALEEHWERIREYALHVFSSQGVDEIVAEELVTPPGMDEVASLMWIKHHKRGGQFDVLVVDCAPTGETLQLLSFPEAVGWYLDKIFPLERRIMKVARPVVQRLTDIPLPTDSIYGDIKQLLTELGDMKQILGDPRICTVRLVLNLEKMVIKEAQRAFTYLSLYDYLTDLVVVNRVLPPEVTDGYFANWRRAQAKYDIQVDQAFSPVPIRRTRLFDQEIIGLERLTMMAQSIYGEEDPSQIYHKELSQQLKKRGSEYDLLIHLPFVGKDEVDVTHREGELFITIGPYKREISLPRVLNGKGVRSAKLDAGTLRISFGANPK